MISDGSKQYPSVDIDQILTIQSYEIFLFELNSNYDTYKENNMS